MVVSKLTVPTPTVASICVLAAVEAGMAEDFRRIVDHGIDAAELLQEEQAPRPRSAPVVWPAPATPCSRPCGRSRLRRCATISASSPSTFQPSPRRRRRLARASSGKPLSTASAAIPAERQVRAGTAVPARRPVRTSVRHVPSPDDQQAGQVGHEDADRDRELIGRDQGAADPTAARFRRCRAARRPPRLRSQVPARDGPPPASRSR